MQGKFLPPDSVFWYWSLKQYIWNSAIYTVLPLSSINSQTYNKLSFIPLTCDQNSASRQWDSFSSLDITISKSE